jgi:cell wall-associated NlpC family hydrolase
MIGTPPLAGPSGLGWLTPQTFTNLQQQVGGFVQQGFNQWGQAFQWGTGQLQQQIGQLGEQLGGQLGGLTEPIRQAGESARQLGESINRVESELSAAGQQALQLPPVVKPENPFTALASGWGSAWPWLISATVLAVGVGVVERFDPRAAMAIAGVTFAAAALAHPNVLQDLNGLLSTGSTALQNATAGARPGGPGGPASPAPPGGFGSAMPSSAGPIGFAQRMVAAGVPYVWGGASPQTGFDCSGLVQWAFGQVGKVLPRTTQTQWAAGQPIQPLQLQPGDVVFFQGTDGPGITHDGIYVGGGQFVHAADPSTGLTTSSLTNAYWASHYAGARRY